ncbi:MAG: PAS domain S-box protein [Haloarculaceae archaeon]
MTVQERASSREPGSVAVWYDAAVAPDEAARDRLEAHLALEVAEWRRLGEGTPATPVDGLVVFSDRPGAAPRVRDRPEPTVWVTTSDAAAAAAYDGGAVDVFAWGPDDDPRLLGRKLDRTLGSGDPRSDEATAGEPGDRPAATGTDLYEELVETVGDAVYVLDSEGRFTFVNDALCELTGYDRTDLLGASVHRIKDDRTVARAERALGDLLEKRRAGADGIDIAKLDVELIRADGERVPCTDRMTLRPPAGERTFTGTIGTLRDVSRQRRRQDILGGLLEASREMLDATTTDEVATLLVEAAERVLDVEMAVLREYDPDRDRLVPVAASDSAEAVLDERPDYRPDEGPVGTAFTQDRLVVDSDLAHVRADAPSVAAYLPVGARRTLSVGRVARGTFTDDERQFLRLLGRTAASVFDRVEREEDLRRSEAVLEAAEDMLFTADASGTLTLVTGQFARFLGYERADLVGRPVADLLDNGAAADTITGELDGTTEFETPLATTGGTAAPARIVASPIRDGGGVVCTVQDLSELKSAQREASRQRTRFTELFETLSDPVADIEYDAGEATIRSVNQAFAGLCEPCGKSWAGRPLAAAFERLPESVAGALEPATESGATIEEEVTVGPVGSADHYLLRTVPYESDDGPRAFVILADVTDVKERETHLAVVHRLLRHNLRNKTTVISGWAEAIRDDADDDALAERADRILAASRSLAEASDTAQTIQRVLSMDDDAPASTPVGDVADGVASVVDSVAGAAGSVSVDASGTVRHSEYLLVAVEELVENAVEHTPPGTDIRVSFREASDGVTVAVHDDGPGLPASEWEIVTGDREVTQLQHMEGLGLWLVRWVVDRHDGRLDLDVTDGEGTTVAMTLPR